MSCLRIHTGDRPYRCVHPGCEKAFTQLSNLQVIINSPHGLEWIHNPAVTSLVWFSLRLFAPPLPTCKKSHQRQHNKDKPFKCSNCFRAYSDSASLQTHLPAHAIKNAKAYCCSMCGRAYTSVSAPPLTAPHHPLPPGTWVSQVSCGGSRLCPCACSSPGDVPHEAHVQTHHGGASGLPPIACARHRLSRHSPTDLPHLRPAPAQQGHSSPYLRWWDILVTSASSSHFDSVISDTQRWCLSTLRRRSGRPINFVLYASL